VGLRRGIEIAIERGFSALEVEGDSLLVIKGLQQLMNGVKAERLSQNWCLSYGFSVLGSMVTSLVATVTEPIRRKANVVTNCMANLGVTMHEQFQIWHPRDPLNRWNRRTDPMQLPR
jgi:hypothetical protein